MSRAVLVQLALFLAIAVGCGVFVLTTVTGGRLHRAPVRVDVLVPDAASLAETSQVTYRGVRTGTVGAVEFDPAGVRLRLLLDPGSRVPADVTARISMDTPMALQHLDLQPATAGPPYLADGDTVRAERTSAPMPLERLLVRADDLARGIDPHDLRVLSETAATGLDGAAPDLRRILDGTRDLTRLAVEREPQLRNLLERGPDLLGTAESAGGLPRLASSLRSLTGQVREREPQLRELAETAPGTTRAVSDLLARNEGAAGALLGNLLVTGEVLGDHVPALRETMTALPQGLHDLASIVHGDIADFYLVVAQGPVCYYGTERRTPVETGPRDPETGWSCAPGPDLEQRGADAAPRPGSSAAAADPASHPAVPPGADPAPASAGGALPGPRPWSSIMFQGVR